MAKKIVDYISGLEIEGGKEEVEATQPFSKMLVEDYGYPKDIIQTRPQFRIKKAPSSIKEDYPLDICIFENNQKLKEELKIIIECKSPDLKTGKTQLENYLQLTSASLGVWFNGNESLYLVKSVDDNKKSFKFKEIYTFPKYGDDLSVLGDKLFKSNLKKDGHLIEVLRLIKSYLVNNETEISSNLSDFASEIIKIIFCKIHDELKKGAEECLDFRVSINETEETTYNRILRIFESVKVTYSDIFKQDDKLSLTPKNIVYVVGKLQDYYFVKSKRDIIKDAFEVFVGVALRGDSGQFFTPRNIAELMVKIANPNEGSKLLDPACGSGGFLTTALDYIWNNIDTKYKGDIESIQHHRKIVAENNIYGIDREAFLVQTTKAYMAIMGDGKSGILHGDTLRHENKNKFEQLKPVFKDGFDVIIANPPYGDKITIDDVNVLKHYKLSKKENKNGILSDLNTVNPEVLFTEYIINNLKNGGIGAVLLPEGIFGNPSLNYVRKYILDNCKLLAVIGLPPETFQPFTSVKTSILVIKKEKIDSSKDYEVMFSMCNYVGHDKNGKPITKDDVETIFKDFELFRRGSLTKISNNSVIVKKSALEKDKLLPLYANYHVEKVNFVSTEQFMTLNDLFDNGVLKKLPKTKNNENENRFYSGVEVGSANYLNRIDNNSIPFVRTSDIHNMEIDYKSTKHISKSTFDIYSKNQNLEEGDLLFVQDGEFLIGECCYIDSDMLNIIIQSHIKIIKVNNVNSFGITPKVLLFLLNENVVKEQLRKFTIKQGTIKTVPFQKLLEVKIRIPKQVELATIESNMNILLDSKKKIRDTLRTLDVSMITLK